MAVFNILPLVQNLIWKPWRIPCTFFSKTVFTEIKNELNVPKKYLSAFDVFKSELTDLMTKENPSIEDFEINNAAKEKWKNITKAEKKKYNTIYKHFLKQHKRISDINKPKKPLPTFFLFLKKQRSEGTKSTFEDNKNFVMEMGNIWNKMSDEEKKEYRNEYFEKYKEYSKNLNQWELEMIEKGNLNFLRTKTLKKAKKN